MKAFVVTIVIVFLAQTFCRLANLATGSWNNESVLWAFVADTVIVFGFALWGICLIRVGGPSA